MREVVAEAICPSCNSSKVRNMGAIPPSASFAGRVLDRPLPGGFLYRCNSCGLGYRHPRPSKARLNELYQAGRDDTWSAIDEADRKDWAIARQWIGDLGQPGDILDVGCFSGDFLLSLGGQHTISGVELHSGAARRAAERGVAIVGTDFDNLDSFEATYDWIVAFDVIEHCDDPRKLLSQLIKKCKPGGKVIISTGNMNAPSWRLMGSRYWYCAIAEHLTFIDPGWCRKAAADCGARLMKLSKFSHEPAPVMQQTSQLMKNLLYCFAPSLAGWVRAKGFGKEDVFQHPELKRSPPKWYAARDHLIVLFQTDSSAVIAQVTP